MSLFNLPVVEKPKKPTSIHPWAKTIKDYYANKIKQAHNSVRAVNKEFPKPKKERIPHPKRVKFTVIGNRVTKEYIYCVNLVQGMHRYRWKYFDTPVIRGCDGVEWAEIWRELKIQHGDMVYCIKDQVAVLCDDEFIGGEKELKDMIETKYVYHLALDYQKESFKHFANYVKSSGRPCAYMHVSIDEKPIGTLIFMLYSDVVPETCENFLRLCRETKGGYSGTPVHRIVKDGWIQCGGYGLKNTSMDCENFIVPHDKRGVLGMANAGRHVKCSTQFYVLLQPNEWLQYRFVAFGQLIDGEETLKKIEQVNTYYEAPAANITIYSAGILNLDCHDIRINKGALEYLDGHVEDLVPLGEMFYQLLMEKVWLEIEFRRIQELMPGEVEGEEEEHGDAFKKTVDEQGNVITKNIEATRRFMQNKEKEKRVHAEEIISKSSGSKKQRRHSAIDSDSSKDRNNDFDVDEYSYEAEEEYVYSQVTPTTHMPKKVMKYFVEWTDVKYPGEVDSNFDLKRLLQGDYCLEADLDEDLLKLNEAKQNREEIFNALSQIITSYGVDVPSETTILSVESMDSDEEIEKNEYIRNNMERVSFSGSKLRNIAKKYRKKNPLEDRDQYYRHYTDEDLRRLRMAFLDYKSRAKKKVSISAEPWATPGRIKRRQTGFVKQDEIRVYADSNYLLYGDNDDEDSETEKQDYDYQTDATTRRKVSLSITSFESAPPHQIIRRQTGYPKNLKPSQQDQQEEPPEQEVYSKYNKKASVRYAPSDTTTHKSIPARPTGMTSKAPEAERPSQIRPSVLMRLFDEIAEDDDKNLPTLKHYTPHEMGKSKPIKLAMSDSDIGINPFLRRDIFKSRLKSITEPEDAKSRVRFASINDSDIMIIDHFDHDKIPLSRGIELNKTRPYLTVSQYQQMNEERREKAKREETDSSV